MKKQKTEKRIKIKKEIKNMKEGMKKQKTEKRIKIRKEIKNMKEEVIQVQMEKIKQEEIIVQDEIKEDD